MELGQLGRNPNRGWQRSLHRLLQLGGLLEASRVLAFRTVVTNSLRVRGGEEDYESKKWERLTIP